MKEIWSWCEHNDETMRDRSRNVNWKKIFTADVEKKDATKVKLSTMRKDTKTGEDQTTATKVNGNNVTVVKMANMFRLVRDSDTPTVAQTKTNDQNMPGQAHYNNMETGLCDDVRATRIIESNEKWLLTRLLHWGTKQSHHSMISLIQNEVKVGTKFPTQTNSLSKVLFLFLGILIILAIGPRTSATQNAVAYSTFSVMQPVRTPDNSSVRDTVKLLNRCATRDRPASTLDYSTSKVQKH